MSDLRDLYQEVIIDHNRHPRNHYVILDANYEAEGFNPLCGDQLKVYLKINKENNSIEKISFEGQGCAISTASASLMTEFLMGKTVQEAEKMFHVFHELMINNTLSESDYNNNLETVGKLKVLMGVREFPSRVKCATLAWHTLQAALQGKSKPVSTE